MSCKIKSKRCKIHESQVYTDYRWNDLSRLDILLYYFNDIGKKEKQTISNLYYTCYEPYVILKLCPLDTNNNRYSRVKGKTKEMVVKL